MNKVTILIEDRIAQAFSDDLNSLFGKYGGDMVWGSDGGVEHVDDKQMFAGNYVDNLLREYRDVKPNNPEPNKPIENNFANNWGFSFDSPEHQLLAAAIDYAQSKRGVDQGWCDARDRYRELKQSPVLSPITKPLLVVSYRQILSKEQAVFMDERLKGALSKVGWAGIVVDRMDNAQVQAFNPKDYPMDTLSLDQLIELLEGVKRLKEATMHGEGGSQH